MSRWTDLKAIRAKLDKRWQNGDLLRALLMDRATLMAYQPLWGREPKPIHHDLPHLDPHEQALYRDLVDNRLGDRVRLEQERIGFERLRRVLGAG